MADAARVAAAVAGYLPAGNPQGLPLPRVAVNVFGKLPRLPNGSYPDRRIDLNDLANMWWNQPGQDRTWPASDRCHYCASAKRNDCDVKTKGYPCTRCENSNRPNCRNGSPSVKWEALRRQEDDDRVAAGLLQNNQRYNSGPLVYSNVNLNPFNHAPPAPPATTTTTGPRRGNNRQTTTTAGASGTRSTRSGRGAGKQSRGTARTRSARTRSPGRGNTTDRNDYRARSPIRTRNRAKQLNFDENNDDKAEEEEDEEEAEEVVDEEPFIHGRKLAAGRQRPMKNPPQNSMQGPPQYDPLDRAFDNLDITMAGMPGPSLPVRVAPWGLGGVSPPISPYAPAAHHPQNGNNATVEKQASFLNSRTAFPNPGLGQGFGGNQGESSRRPGNDLNIAAQTWNPAPPPQPQATGPAGGLRRSGKANNWNRRSRSRSPEGPRKSGRSRRGTRCKRCHRMHKECEVTRPCQRCRNAGADCEPQDAYRPRSPSPPTNDDDVVVRQERRRRGGRQRAAQPPSVVQQPGPLQQPGLMLPPPRPVPRSSTGSQDPGRTAFQDTMDPVDDRLASPNPGNGHGGIALNPGDGNPQAANPFQQVQQPSGSGLGGMVRLDDSPFFNSTRALGGGFRAGEGLGNRQEAGFRAQGDEQQQANVRNPSLNNSPPNLPVPYISGQNFPPAIDSRAFGDNEVGNSLIPDFTLGRPLPNYAIWAWDGSQEYRGPYQWPFPDVEPVDNSRPLDPVNHPATDYFLNCMEEDGFFDVNRGGDLLSSFPCGRQRVKECETTLAGKQRHGENPWWTCEDCHEDQLLNLLDDDNAHLESSKSPLCGDCAQEAITRRLVLPQCVCMATKMNRWLCHSHRIEVNERIVPAIAGAEEYLVRIQVLGLPHEPVRCLGCYIAVGEPDSGVWSCKICRQWAGRTSR